MSVKQVWGEIHENEESWRRKTVGEISDLFIIPRYLEFIASKVGEKANQSCLEIGAGQGDLSSQVLRRFGTVFSKYSVTEYFDDGVAWLKSKGFDAHLADAQNLPFADGSFDWIFEFDVMHHVDEPRKMAHEMMRVGRGKCLLTESNGLSVFRKLKELTPAHRKAGERSFTPETWRSFFEGHSGFKLEKFEIFPFLFPLKAPSRFMPAVVAFNRWIEKAPFVRWQCSSVAIYLEYSPK